MNTEINMPILRSVSASQDAPRPAASQNSDAKPVKQSEEKPAQLLGSEDTSSVVAELNSLAQNLQRNLVFSVDQKSGDTVIKVLDKETDEVVREIPSKDLREIKARLEETAGIIFKDSV